MQLTQVFTQANSDVELEFRAMERSLRATGCDLPLRVIPYDDRLFELPSNATWWNPGQDLVVLSDLATHPCHKRYSVLTQSNYQYADTDIIFLRDPCDVMSEHSGFVATCTQWRLPEFAVCPESKAWFQARSSTWPLSIFNSGQFASEERLYEPRQLIDAMSQNALLNVILLKDAPWDQPGFNVLVHQAGATISNLTLPPFRHPSTWAGDYGDDYRQQWEQWNQMPYLIHWAGGCLYRDLAINELFLEFLTKDEKQQFEEKRKLKSIQKVRQYRASLSIAARLKFDLGGLVRNFTASTGGRKATMSN